MSEHDNRSLLQGLTILIAYHVWAALTKVELVSPGKCTFELNLMTIRT